MKWIADKIDKNRLPIELDDYIWSCEKLVVKYPDLDEYKLFYQYIIDQIFADIFHYRLSIYDNTDKIVATAGNIIRRVKLRGLNTTYYEFDQADYEEWSVVRTHLYSKYDFKDPYDVPQLRLLNYFEMSCMNFITDITSKSNYESVHIKWKTHEYDVWKRFEKTGFGVSNDNISFIKYIKKIFNEDYIFKPVK